MSNLSTTASPIVVGGVDTHKELHVVAVVDAHDRVIGTESFSTTRAGYRALVRWMRTYGDIARVGVECTGSYGAGLMRHLDTAGIDVLEVTAGDKVDRRKRGKDDTIDAEQAAHAAYARVRTVTPRAHDGMVESLRALKIARSSAISARRVALQLIHATIISAPEELRDQLRNMTRMQLIRTLASWRPDLSGYRDPVTATKISLRSLARRYLELHDEIADLQVPMHALVDELAPDLLARIGIGYESAAQLLITAGDNPERLASEASFAMLCGAAPLPASSGMTTRHRLNRGGDRAANSALHMIAISRWRIDPTLRPTSPGRRPSSTPIRRSCAASSATSLARSTTSCATSNEPSTRLPQPLDKQKGVRGTQYASAQITAFAAANGLIRSMGYTGICWDNAMAESFFATLKTEFYYRRVWPTKKAARIAVGNWIEDRYNRRRRHSSIGQISPVDFELQYSRQIADLQKAA
jgi:transposase